MRRHTDIRYYIYLTICCLTAVTIISILNWYATPTMSDDIMYLFVWQKEWQIPFERITSFEDVVKSQLIHYELINGRSLTHSLAQIGLNLVPAAVAKLINIVMFLVLIVLTTIYSARDKKYRLIIGVMVFASIFFFLKGFDTAFLWLLGSFTYVWALVFSICFLLLIRKLNKSRMNWKLLPLIPLSFLLGWSHEAIALPLSLSFLLFMIVNHKGVLLRASTYCMMAYICGMLMIVTSPALWFRTDIEGITISQRILTGFINFATNVKISWLLIVSLLWTSVRNRHQLAVIVHFHGYLLFAWIMALGIVFLCGTSLERVAVCADFLAIIILVQIWQSQSLINYQYTIINIFLIAAILTAVPATVYSKQNYYNYLYHQSQLQKDNVSLISIRQIDSNLSWIEKQIVERYINPTVEFGFYSCYMPFDKKDSNMIAVGQKYGKTNIIMLPEDVVNHIQSDSAAYSHWEADAHQQLYVQLLPKGKKVNHVTFLLTDEVSIAFYQRILTYNGYEYELPDFNHEVITIQGRNYLVMTIPPKNIKRRIKDIRIE